MADYQKMYAILCAAVDSALDQMEHSADLLAVMGQLQAALLEAEEVYIETSAYAEECVETGIIQLKVESFNNFILITAFAVQHKAKRCVGKLA